MENDKIKRYTDPDSFMAVQADYPCHTQFMEYNVLTSRYYLTEHGLKQYGIDLNDYQGSKELFITEVSDDIYGIMNRVAPFNYQYNCYLVAQSISGQFSKYQARKEFEKALAYQAQYKLLNIDVRDISGIDLETGNNIYHKQLRKEFRHMSAKAMDILQSLGLLFNGHIAHKHMINYKELM